MDEDTIAAIKAIADVWKQIQDAPESSGGSFCLHDDGSVTEERWHTKRFDQPIR